MSAGKGKFTAGRAEPAEESVETNVNLVTRPSPRPER